MTALLLLLSLKSLAKAHNFANGTVHLAKLSQILRWFAAPFICCTLASLGIGTYAIP